MSLPSHLMRTHNQKPLTAVGYDPTSLGTCRGDGPRPCARIGSGVKRVARESWPDFAAENYFGVGPSDGLLAIYAPPERRQKLVVLVHGLGGDRFQTWGHMPQFLFEDFGADGVDVGLYGYRSGMRRLFRPDTSSFKETAASLAGELKDSGYREILLFGHSMGGLVCRQTIRHLNDIGELNLPDGPQIVGSISFASPFAGTTKSGFPIRLLHPEARLLAAFSDTTTELKTFWAAQVEGKDPKVDLEVFAAWAQYDKLVRTASAIDGVEHANTKEVTGADHSSLVKPADSSDALYEWVYERVRDIFFEPGPTDREIQSVQAEAAERAKSGAAAGGAALLAREGGGEDPGPRNRMGDGRPPDFDQRPSRDLVVPATTSGGAGRGRGLLAGAVAAALLLAGVLGLSLLGGGSDDDDAVAAEPTAVIEPTPVATSAPEPTAMPTAEPEPTAAPTPAPTATPAPEPTPTATAEPTPEPTVTADVVEILPGAAAIELGSSIGPDGLSDDDRAALAAAVAAVQDGAASSIQITVPGTASAQPDAWAAITAALQELAGCDPALACPVAAYSLSFTEGYGPDEPLAATGAATDVLAVVGTAMVGAGGLLVSFARHASRQPAPPVSRRGRAVRR